MRSMVEYNATINAVAMIPASNMGWFVTGVVFIAIFVTIFLHKMIFQNF
jgi:hypothetical protein